MPEAPPVIMATLPFNNPRRLCSFKAGMNTASYIKIKD